LQRENKSLRETIAILQEKVKLLRKQ